VFLAVRKGRLFLEGVEIAWRWPDSLADPGVLLAVEDGDVFLTDCTISAAGKPRAGVTLARFRSEKESRCRLSRCHARGAGLTTLDLDGGGAEVLFDGCLIVGDQQPLLRVRNSDQKPAKLRFVRSTLIGGAALLELRPATGARAPGVSCLAWDSLLGRSNLTAGDLLALSDGAEPRNVEWRGGETPFARREELAPRAEAATNRRDGGVRGARAERLY